MVWKEEKTGNSDRLWCSRRCKVAVFHCSLNEMPCRFHSRFGAENTSPVLFCQSKQETKAARQPLSYHRSPTKERPSWSIYDKANIYHLNRRPNHDWRAMDADLIGDDRDGVQQCTACGADGLWLWRSMMSYWFHLRGLAAKWREEEGKYLNVMNEESRMGASFHAYHESLGGCFLGYRWCGVIQRAQVRRKDERGRAV